MCIIVDDEPLALDILEDYIRRTPSLELAGRFTGGADALRSLDAGGIDLAFLDIQMPGMNGLDMAKLVGGDVRVVFTTAFPQYAIDGFRVDALDYLLKPINFAEFTRSVEKAVEWFEIKRAADGATASGVSGSSGVSGDAGSGSGSGGSGSGTGTDIAGRLNAPRALIVKSDYKQFVIPIDTIVYIEGIRDYIRIHLLGGGSVQTLMNMKTVEKLLPADRFARVHRSYIVNLDEVKRIERTRIVFEGALSPDSPEPLSIPISDTYKEPFLKALALRSL